MSIRIDNITRGRFGNKILQYNTLLQIANKYNIDASCCNFHEDRYFKNILSSKPILKDKKKELLFCKKIIDEENLNFNNKYYTLDDPAYCLHNTFFQVTNKDPREFLQLKEEYKPKINNDYYYVGLHLRGGDIIKKDGNNGREIHEFNYYKNSINYVIENFKDKKIVFYICTDDKNFKSYLETVNYLKENNLDFKLGNIDSYIHDFGILSECDILINSSSTFCLCAGFLGKKDKFIIHSKNWINKNINHEKWNDNKNGKILDYRIIEFRHTFDNFWINVSKGENKFYKANILL